jgi:hypothetical protein
VEPTHWSRALLLLQGGFAAASVVLVGLGFVVVAIDAVRDDGQLDDLGVFLGLVMAGFFAVMALVFGLLCRSTLVGRRRAAGGAAPELRSSARLSVAVAVLWLLLVGSELPHTDSPALWLCLGVGGAALLVASIGVLVSASS